MKRRDFIKNTGAATFAGMMTLKGMNVSMSASNEKDSRPNILYIVTDQQSWDMMSCAGNKYVNTPALDRMAANGVRFTNAYCPNPLCVPSRMSMVTGRMPSEMNMHENNSQDSVIPPEFAETGLGHLMNAAGYDTAFAGKTHLGRHLNLDMVGFDNYLTKDEREECARVTADFIKQDRDKPFFLITNLINPHDICHMAIRAHPVREFDFIILKKCVTEQEMLDEALKLPEGVDEETFFKEYCPPVPPNYDPIEGEPQAMQDYLDKRPFMRWIRENWTDEDWRMHRWAYARLTERVDREIATIMEALEETGQWENTIVVFSSDHGDNDASYRTEHKSLPYDSSAKIPFIVSRKGMARSGETDERLVMNSLDFFATACDYAGIEKPATKPGMSVRPLVEGKETPWRDSLVVETELGRMIRNDRYKYIVFECGAEQLLDLQEDPWETKNVIGDPALADVTADLKKKLYDYVHSINDPFGTQYVKKPA